MQLEQLTQFCELIRHHLIWCESFPKIDGCKISVVSRNKLINDQKGFLNVCFATIPNNCQIEFPHSNSGPISYSKWLTKPNTLFRYYVSRASISYELKVIDIFITKFYLSI